ncbi:peptide ligase PGM1-related protein [Pseudanabaena sp. FACHB-2040]|uniref:peptide ligase PGM1-related protein n=1 Tax=Pseudanabaena sp. FACHB-2040 TaxID=2692859 RepID=UPI001686BC5A|nr:peptide ligase PGM1-related protein [Pseudanabaena sp. FACHB-2040]MBD2256431.1 carboxylate-amine ligase [Pseudanabaena sp. FACHB-2040]
MIINAPSYPELDQATRFRQLQTQLRQRWLPADDFDDQERQILVVPSLSMDQEELQKIAGVHYYEERLLFSLIRLRNPNTRLVYVTSQPLHPSIVDYYLELLPGIPSSHARNRLELFAAYDASKKPLSQKLLDRPRLLEKIRKTLNPEQAYMVCYNSTELERQLALALDIPLLALDPDLLYWGTKSGSREIFAACGIPHPDGSELVHTQEDLAQAISDVWERQPDLKRMVIKLNQGFSGEGNALLDLRSLTDIAPGAASHRERLSTLRSVLPELRFQCETETWENFYLKVGDLGAIAEAFIEGDEKLSPSAQGRITPFGEVEMLSTHDQILGGPDGQIFLGCSFPADAAYRLEIQEMGRLVGEQLAAKGALERYGVDFIAVKQPPGSPEPWKLYAIEINLRKGGTTHPFMALKLLTEGSYNLADGLFYTRQGQAKYYRASDNLQNESYRGLLPSDLMDIIVAERLHFNSINGTGAAFHLMGCLSEYGKLGITSIGNSPQQAEDIYHQVAAALDKATQS